jgi:hypothetical protein
LSPNIGQNRQNRDYNMDPRFFQQRISWNWKFFSFENSSKEWKGTVWFKDTYVIILWEKCLSKN